MPKKLLTCALIFGILLGLFIPGTAFARDELKNTDPERYYIELDTGNQVITVYEKDDAGEYTRIVRRMICTSGRTDRDPNDPLDIASPTPGGKWKIGARERFGKFAAFNAEYARYWTQMVGGIYFHSIMFAKRDVTTIKQGPYNKLGNRGSHGCVRLYVEDAKWMYYHACPGTTVNVVARGSKKGLTASLKSEMSFKEYNVFQQNIFDEEPQANISAWVVADKAQMRTGNGTNDKFIKNIYKDTEVEVLQEGDPWIKVLVDGREGYVKRAYMSYEKGVLQSTPDGKVAKGTLYLYAEPSTRSERLYKVPRDSSLAVLEEETPTEGWTCINFWGTIGYIQTRSIKTDWAMIYDWAEVEPVTEAEVTPQ